MLSSRTAQRGEGADVHPLTGVHRLTAEAQSLYRAFYRSHNELAAAERGDARAFLSKAEQLPLRLALVLHQIVIAEISASANDDSGSTGALSNEASNTLATRQCHPTEIAAETMQSAIRLAQWFIHEARRVYYLLEATPEERLALELETWIAGRGGKTTLAQIEKEAPRKFCQQKGHPDALLKIVARLSRGDFRYVIWPVHTGARAPGGNQESSFWLKEVKRAA